LSEAGVPNGVVDRRNAVNHTAARAPLLMVHYGMNTKYIPNSDLAIAPMLLSPGRALQSADQGNGPWQDLTSSTPLLRDCARTEGRDMQAAWNLSRACHA